jgi:hypothetical protein
MPARKQPAKGTTPGGRYRQVAECRRKDSRALLEKCRYDAAVYLAGYIVECQLKHAVTASLRAAKLPAKYECHEWDLLVDAAGLRPALAEPVYAKIQAAFVEVREAWQPSIRYFVNKFNSSAAARFCKLAEEVHTWLKSINP